VAFSLESEFHKFDEGTLPRPSIAIHQSTLPINRAAIQTEAVVQGVERH